jgi:urea transport system substrate-binding protein
MRIDRRTFVKTSSLAALSLAAPAIIGRAAADDHIKLVSILDQSGGLDIYGKPMVDATVMAVDEINAAGGLLGRQVELINYDPQSTIQFYTQYATQAAAGDRADVVHAGITSASREAIRPTLGRFNTLYFYNVQYEGGCATATASAPARPRPRRWKSWCPMP